MLHIITVSALYIALQCLRRGIRTEAAISCSHASVNNTLFSPGCQSGPRLETALKKIAPLHLPVITNVIIPCFKRFTFASVSHLLLLPCKDHIEDQCAPPQHGSSMCTKAYQNDGACHGSQDAEESEAGSDTDVEKGKKSNYNCCLISLL